MPTLEQIHNSFIAIASQWYLLAVAWHIYFAILGLILAFGIRPPKRITAVLLVLPLLCVSVQTWLSPDPVNSALTGLAAISLLLIAIRLPQEQIKFGSSWLVSMGIFLFSSGWLYPPFLAPNLLATNLYAASTWLIPCSTLAIITGLSLIVNGLESRRWSLILGAAGLFYGLFGVVSLGFTLNLFLLLGALLSILLPYLPKSGSPKATFSPKGV